MVFRDKKQRGAHMPSLNKLPLKHYRVVEMSKHRKHEHVESTRQGLQLGHTMHAQMQMQMQVQMQMHRQIYDLLGLGKGEHALFLVDQVVLLRPNHTSLQIGQS
jgi:hypothetical protein